MEVSVPEPGATPRPKRPRVRKPPLPQRRLVSLGALARELGVSPPAVRKAINEHRIGAEAYRKQDNGRYLIDADLATRHWRERTDQRRSAVRAEGTPGAKAGAAALEAAAGNRMPVDADGNPMTLVEIQTVRVAGQVELDRIKRAELQGQLVRARDVAARWRDLCRRARDRMLALAARESPRLCHLHDPVEHEIALERAIREALTTLADELGAPA